MGNSFCVLKNLKREDIKRDPFTYLKIQNCLDEKIYNELDKTFINYKHFNYKEDDNNICYRISSLEFKKKKTNLWNEFIEYHTSKEFFKKISDIFDKDISNFNLKNSDSIGKRFDIFYRSKLFRKSINLDCQLVINTPVKRTSEVVEPHLDSLREIYAGLLYMKNKDDFFSGGDLIIYSYINKKLYGKSRAKKEDIIIKDKIEYKANQLAFFINSPLALHGVSSRDPNHNFRKYINIIGETEKPLFSIEKFFI